jgi:hypothetical protein
MRTSGGLLLLLFSLAVVGMQNGSFHSLEREGAWSLMKAVFWVWCCWIPMAVFTGVRFWKQADRLFLAELITSVSIFSLLTVTELLR